MDKSWKDDWKNSPGKGRSHYDIAIQPIEYFASAYKQAISANIIKYAMRHLKKNGKEDLEKARWYTDWLMRAHKATPVSSKEFIRANELEDEVAEIIVLLEGFKAIENRNSYTAGKIIEMIDKQLIKLIEKHYE